VRSGRRCAGGWFGLGLPYSMNACICVTQLRRDGLVQILQRIDAEFSVSERGDALVFLPGCGVRCVLFGGSFD
jgi:hypothetical protein